LPATEVYDLNPNGAVAWSAATTNALQAGARVTA